MIGTIVVGDHGGDGHERTVTFQMEIPCGLAEERLEVYFQKAVDSGLPDITDFCTEFEDNWIPKDIMVQFERKFGVRWESGTRPTTVDEYAISPLTYASIWVGTVNEGLYLAGKSGRVELLSNEKGLEYDIGGYGLFRF